MTARYVSVTDTAKALRLALKSAFPATRFSVRSKSYSGGASIDVAWTDGPTSGRVEEITESFAGATFDGMQDLKAYHRSLYQGEVVHWGADFVFTHRRLSSGFYRQLAAVVCATLGVAVPEIVDANGETHIPWQADQATFVPGPTGEALTLSQIIRRVANDRGALDQIYA